MKEKHFKENLTDEFFEILASLMRKAVNAALKKQKFLTEKSAKIIKFYLKAVIF